MAAFGKTYDQLGAEHGTSDARYDKRNNDLVPMREINAHAEQIALSYTGDIELTPRAKTYKLAYREAYKIAAGYRS